MNPLLLPLLFALAPRAADPPEVLHQDAHYTRGSSDAPVAAPWWQTWGDAELRALVQEGLSANQDLSAAQARLDQADALSQQALAAVLPSIGLDASGSTGPYSSLGFQFGADMSNVPDPPDLYSRGSAKASASLAADIWGKNTLAFRSGRRSVEATVQDVRGAMITVAASIANSWYSLVAARQQVAVVQAQLQANQDLLEIVRLRYDRGSASALDVLQQRQQAAATAALLPSVRYQVAVAEHALQVLLGRDPTDPACQPFPALDTLPAVPPLPPLGLPADLLDNRPDLLAARARVESAELSRRSTNRSLLPTLAISGDAGWEAITTTESRTQDTWGLSASLSVPLFAGGSMIAGIKAARAELDAESRSYDQSVLQALQEVENALAMEAALAEQQQAWETQRNAAAQAFQESRARWQEGLADYLSVLAAMQGLQQAEINVINTHRDRLSARITLHSALGGPWVRELDPQGVTP